MLLDLLDVEYGDIAFSRIAQIDAMPSGCVYFVIMDIDMMEYRSLELSGRFSHGTGIQNAQRVVKALASLFRVGYQSVS